MSQARTAKWVHGLVGRYVCAARWHYASTTIQLCRYTIYIHRYVLPPRLYWCMLQVAIRIIIRSIYP